MDSSYTRTGLSVLSDDGSDAVSAYRTSIRNLAAWAEASAALRGQGLLSARPAAGKAGTFYKATDDTTGILYYDNGTTWETVGDAPPTDGSAATPSLRTLGAGATQAAAGNHSHGGVTAQYVRKTAATTRQSTATLAGDPDLTLTLAASGTYRVTCNVIYAAPSTPKMRMNFSLGTGITRRSWVMIGTTSNEVTSAGATYTTGADVITVSTGSGLGDGYGYFRHELILSTTSTGTFFVTLQWAQQFSNAAAVTVYDGSYMVAEKFA